MARIVLLLIILAAIAGALFLFSSNAREEPTKTIEVDVAASNAS